LTQLLNSVGADVGIDNGNAVYSTSRVDNEPVYTIDETYQYPYIPATKEGAEISRYEHLLANVIPEEILKNMTTEALVRTAVTTPFIADFIVFDTREMGYDMILGTCNVMRELVDRPNALEIAIKVIEEDDGTIAEELVKPYGGKPGYNGEKLDLKGYVKVNGIVLLQLLRKDWLNNDEISLTW
jgi:hypothetical protein